MIKKPRAASAGARADANARVRVREYFAATPAAARRRLAELRTIIAAAAPGATEGFGYEIPGFKQGGKVLVYYAAFKQHVSIYPISRSFEQANAALLAKYSTSGRGTLRFPLDRPVPKGLVRRVVADRLAAVRAKEHMRRG
jgi:uncharacterized protein YdhG (YjbR/CyaY superfamily)